MKKSITLFIINLLLIFSTELFSQSFYLSGKITGCDENMVYLKNTFAKNSRDSTKCKNDIFSFSIDVEEPVLISLSTNKNNSSADFFLENRDMNFQANIDSLWDFKLNSSKLNDAYFDLNNRFINPIRIAMADNTIELYQKLNPMTDSLETKIMLSKNDALLKISEVFVTNFINENKDNFFAIYLLKNNYSTYGVENSIKFISLMPDSLKKLPSAVRLLDKLNKIKSVSVGQDAPFIDLLDNKNQLWSFLSVKNKFIFINFWASWCGPCRSEHPKMVEIINKYSKKDIIFISVSIDEDKSKWLAAINKDSLFWTQLIDNNGEETKSMRNEFGITTIPQNFLVGENGKILKQGFAIEELEDILDFFLEK